ncbi:MAG TPA: response regulator, partial [Aquabacterium sp.]|nr:response regulator [Aquabacterium sp.]
GYEGTSQRVLVVDDVPANRRMLLDWLEPLGFEVRVAVDGVDALVHIAEQSPALILMDIVMPEMDGLTAIEHIRRKLEWSDLPVVALSANASMADRERALQAGADGFLPKPLERDALLAQIGQCLALRWRRSA